jgi:hypothetical protein
MYYSHRLWNCHIVNRKEEIKRKVRRGEKFKKEIGGERENKHQKTTRGEGWTHRLNMELDLQSLFGLLCTAVLIG